MAWVSARDCHVHEVTATVTRSTVAAVVDGRALFDRAGQLREKYCFETACETEAEAWEVCAREIDVIRARVQAAADMVAAKAAACRVGEAVPA
jgi:hypothetical protein